MKKGYILQDIPVAIGAAYTCIICGVVLIWTILNKTPRQPIEVIIIVAIINIYIYFCFIFIVIPRLNRLIVVDNIGISSKCFFFKTDTIPYEKMIISIAYYSYSGFKNVGLRYFIVFSKRTLSAYERENANRINPKEEIIKVHYSKFTVRFFQKHLPEKQLEQFNRVITLFQKMKTGDGSLS